MKKKHMRKERKIKNNKVGLMEKTTEAIGTSRYKVKDLLKEAKIVKKEREIISKINSEKENRN